MVKKRGRYLKFATHFKVLAEMYYIPKMGVVVLRANCPTNKGSCPIHSSHESARWPVPEMAGMVMGWEQVGHHHLHRVTVGGHYIVYTKAHESITHRVSIPLGIGDNEHYTLDYIVSDFLFLSVLNL